ncbi:MAG: hypothetical protein JAZ03_06930, partial [Candidatus Thiodiazotropha taylori]|nr:hypothetical protein [Candidatus Thiodiazotropha taylori]MCW4333656.1 hypothetical protein [Candidatus Thiodiazotropha endolucinida]
NNVRDLGINNNNNNNNNSARDATDATDHTDSVQLWVKSVGSVINQTISQYAAKQNKFRKFLKM